MTRYTRVRLQPRGPFHFGGRGVGLERSDVSLPADSLFSALCTSMALRRGPQPVEALLRKFIEAQTAHEAPFRLTSLMPFAAGSSFLPYPMIGPPDVPNATDLRTRKLFKDIEWVSEAVFNCLVQHKSLQSALEGGKPITVQGRKVWVTSDERQTLEALTPAGERGDPAAKPVLWSTWHRPRVTVDRRTSASALYSVGGTLFHRYGEKPEETAGLYTVIEWLSADGDLQDWVEAAFKDLGYEGIGGKRSNGYGQYDPVIEKLDAWDIGSATGGYFTTLSPYLPRRDEQDVIRSGARYEISLRRGWLSLPGYTNIRRSSVRMIADGSLLRWPKNDAPLGQMADVTPEVMKKPSAPRVYRYGLVFPVRIDDAVVTTLQTSTPAPCAETEVQG